MIAMSECVFWQGNKTRKGYGVKVVNYSRKMAHRWAWENANGEIPKGLIIDHTCHTEAVANGECQGGDTCKHRSCVNVEHLELVTPSENVRRGLHFIGNRTTCRQGHDYTNPDNILVRKSGKRECRQCWRERSSRNYRMKAGK